MFWRKTKRFFLIFSVLIALGVSALWLAMPTIKQNEDGGFPQIAYRACDFSPSLGGTRTTAAFGICDNGIYFWHKTDSLLSKTAYAATFVGLKTAGDAAKFVDFYVAGEREEASRRRWTLDVYREFVSMDGWIILEPNLWPDWKYGGFDFTRQAGPNRLMNSRVDSLVVPYWFILALALIAPAVSIWRSNWWRAGRRVLAGRCRVCGCDRKGAKGNCPECGVGPSWAGQKAARLGEWRFVLWWVVPLLLAACALCVPNRWPDFYNYGYGWREVFVGSAFLWMIGVVVSRAFVARQPPPEPPRGFAVVMKPPPGGETGPGRIKS